MRRIVVRGPNWLGDLVMAAPAIRSVVEHWPDAHVDVAVPAAFAPLVPVLQPGASALGLEGGRTGRAVLRHTEQLRDGAYDLAILLTNSFGTAYTTWRAGIPERWGYRRDLRGGLLTKAIVPKRVRRESTHHADYYAALVDALGLPRPSLTVQSALPESARDEARARLMHAGWDGHAPLLVCAPGAAYGTAKQWPPSQVAEVAVAWIAHGGMVALVGAPADQSAVDAVLTHVRRDVPDAPLFDLTGRTNLVTFAGVLATATRVLANDSGAMHVAAALGTPTVTVFGPTREHATSPLGPHVILTSDAWCRPCMLRECPLDHRCMTGVPATRVIDALRS